MHTEEVQLELHAEKKDVQAHVCVNALKWLSLSFYHTS